MRLALPLSLIIAFASASTVLANVAPLPGERRGEPQEFHLGTPYRSMEEAVAAMKQYRSATSVPATASTPASSSAAASASAPAKISFAPQSTTIFLGGTAAALALGTIGLFLSRRSR